MLLAERRAQILGMVERHGVVRIADLVAHFGVSRMTARRDLDALVEEGLLDNARGGAMARDAGSNQVRTDEEPAQIETERIHVGMMVPTTQYYYRDVIDGARRVLQSLGAQLSLVTCGYSDGQTSNEQASAEHALVEELLALGVDGLLLSPVVGDSTAGSLVIDWVQSLVPPVVLVEREPPKGHAVSAWSVATDYEAGVSAAVNHLAELGHDRISLAIPNNSQPWRGIHESWQANLAARGIDTNVPVFRSREAKEALREDTEYVEHILHELRRSAVTAIICCNDRLAIAVAQRARTSGWRLPDELSIIAYDDEIAGLAVMPMTAVSPPKNEIGSVAARALLEQLEETTPSSTRRIRIEPQLIVRDSTCPPGGGETRSRPSSRI